MKFASRIQSVSHGKVPLSQCGEAKVKARHQQPVGEKTTSRSRLLGVIEDKKKKAMPNHGPEKGQATTKKQKNRGTSKGHTTHIARGSAVAQHWSTTFIDGRSSV